MTLIVTGSIGIDSIEAPTGTAEDVLGGSSVYFAAAASLFGPVRMVGAVGDGLLMVIGADETDREALREAVGQLRQVHVPLLGLVINKVKERKGYYGYYSCDYGQDYGSSAGDGRGGERQNRLRRMIGLSK